MGSKSLGGTGANERLAVASSREPRMAYGDARVIRDIQLQRPTQH